MKENITKIIRTLSLVYIGIIIIKIVIETVKIPSDFLFQVDVNFIKILMGFVYIGFSYIVDFFTREIDETEVEEIR